MSEIKYSDTPWSYCAYIFLLFSYLNVNILFIRMFIIGAAVFFLLMGVEIGNVWVDSIVFNSVFIIINLTYIYFILLKYLPIKLSPMEQRIFNKDFQKVMDKRNFRDLIRKAHLRTFSEGGQICHNGNTFSGLFYVALLNPAYKVTYIKNGKEYFDVEENVWIGVVEYMMLEKEKKILMQEMREERKRNKTQIDDKEKAAAFSLIKKKSKGKVKWGLDALVRERSNPLQSDDPFYIEEDEPCYVYEFPIGELEKLFQDKKEGTIWRNALYSIWLGYTTSAVQRVDKTVLDHHIKHRQTDGMTHSYAGATNGVVYREEPEAVTDKVANNYDYSNDFKRYDKLKQQEIEFVNLHRDEDGSEREERGREINNNYIYHDIHIRTESRSFINDQDIKVNVSANINTRK